MIKLLISGDFCPIGRNDKLLKEEKYKELFNGFENLSNTVDFSIVNLECPITSSTQKIIKTGPNIKSENTNAFKALKFAGFNLLCLANNHIQDYSQKGVMDTLAFAEEYGFNTVGAAKDRSTAAKPFIKEIRGIKLGIINIAENEFCAATKNSAGAYTFDFIENTQEIQKLRNKVDKIILIYHGGREHFQLPTPELRKRLRYFISLGVDAVVAHHTHCVSGYEYLNNGLIIYSLGNFIFDYKKKYQKGKWTKGMSVILSLKDGVFFPEFIPHYQGREEDPSLRILEGSEKLDFLREIEHFREIIEDDKVFEAAWEKYLKTQDRYYLSSLYINNFYLRALFLKGLLPIALLKYKKKKLLLNLMRCETHREIAVNILDK